MVLVPFFLGEGGVFGCCCFCFFSKGGGEWKDGMEGIELNLDEV